RRRWTRLPPPRWMPVSTPSRARTQVRVQAPPRMGPPMLEHRDCAEIDEMLPAYAMGALDDADRVRVDSHLVSCDRHEDAFAWGEVALRLADLAPEVTPPEALRERILAIPSGPPVPVAAPI